MKIIKKTEHLLKLNNLGEIISSAISVTGFFCGIPLLMMLFILPYTGVKRLSCNKIEPRIANCELSMATFMGLKKDELTSIEQVQGARFETSQTTDSDGTPMTVNKVFLVTKKRETLLGNLSANDANSFNEYIETSTGELALTQDNRLSFLGIMLFPSLFLVIGFVVMSRVLGGLICKTYIFDKDASILTIKKRGIRVNEVTERSLSEIAQVKFENTDHMDDYTSYEVRLLMNGGDILSLGGSSNQKEQQKIADWIRSYLDGRSN
ncbi:hypothetical protein [Microcoleus sp. OTE_8_concoct_300]|uniref:hypothetical protein n=1 Tax=Microcoleus sp. OTE_8_concoct_300 TaxID=2964710 RepID=UPI00403F6A69